MMDNEIERGGTNMNDRCPICMEWLFKNLNHICKPAWECRFTKGGAIYVDDDQEWEPVYTYSAETAAEKFCERYDCEGGEYTILSLGERNPPIVEVRAQGKDTVQKFQVVGTSEPVYRGELTT